MSPLDLYVTPLCPFAHRVRIVISEKRLPARIVEVDLDDKPSEFLALSPEGTVPALRHDGHGLWNSAAIVEYLDESFPAVPMMPIQPLARARARNWMRAADARLYEHTSQLLHSPDPAVHARSLIAIEQDLLHLEEGVFGADVSTGADGPYWLGAEFTLVDATYYPWFEQFEVLRAFFGLQWPDRCPRLARWRQAVAARPSVRAIAQSADFYLQRYRALHEARRARIG